MNKLLIAVFFIFIFNQFNESEAASQNDTTEYDTDLSDFEIDVIPIALMELTKNIKPLNEKQNSKYIAEKKLLNNNILCSGCWSIAKPIIQVIKSLKTDEDKENFKQVIINLCVFFNIQTKEVCIGAVNLNWPVFVYIIQKNDTELDYQTICSVLMQSNDCPNNNPVFDWKLQIESNYPDIKESKKILTSPLTLSSPISNSKKLKILHLSDIHYDPMYIVGSDGDCKEPLCCIKPIETNILLPNDFSRKAGKWSDYRDCDVPWHMYTDTLEQIKKKYHDIDYIYFTGDIINHAVWKTTQSGNRKYMKDVYDYVKKVFGNIPMFPILGNHESHPLNLYAPDDVTHENLTTQWLYDLIAEEWKDWLPDSDAQKTLRTGGYYTYVPKKGFRVIGLNNNDAYTYNFWLLYKPEYISRQLQWLHDVLLKAENSNEFVHILMHIPSGDETCFKTWSREFRRIIERFYHIISGIFTGHTHYDEFNLYYSTKNPKYAINVAWNGGSLTPFSNVNPNYRIYELETSTYQVIKHETLIYNLTTANANPSKSPEWYTEYTFTDAYGLNDLSPHSLDQLVTKFKNDNNLLYKYWEHKVKLGDPSLKQGCNNECLKKHFCEIVRTSYDDKSKC